MSDPVTSWLTVLAGLVNPALPADALETLLLLRPHIKAEFSEQWLTSESARAVAEAKRFTPVPSWDVVASVLRQYARDNRPITAGRLPAPREPDYPRPDAAEIQRVGELLDNWLASKIQSPSSSP